jgi:hypothetical protein
MTPQNLKRTRQLISERHPMMLAALDRLQRRAEIVMREGPYSVMNKKTVPPSGDKHDYYSIGPYWWPNPETLDGLPYIRRDGLVNPERESVATDSASLDAMSRNAVTLILAQAFTGESRFGHRAMQLIRTWFIDPHTRMNPNLRYGQAIPGICDGRGIGIVDTEEWVDLIRLLIACPPPQLTISDALALRNWFDDYIDWLLTNDLGLTERMEHNNHGTWYDAQVAWFCLYCDRINAAREIVRSVLGRRVAKQIEPDGKQPHEWARTRPMSYTCFNLEAFMHLADAGDEVGINLWREGTDDNRSIKRAAEWVMPFVTRAWQMNLDPPDARERILPLMRRAALALGDDQFEQAINALPRDQWWPMRFNLLYPPAQVDSGLVR